MTPNKGQLFCSEFMQEMSEKLSDKSVLNLIEFVMPESDNEGFVKLKGSEDDVFKALNAITKASDEAGYKGKTMVFGDESQMEAKITFTKKS